MEKSHKQRHKRGGSSPHLIHSKSSSTAAIPSPPPKTSISSKNSAKKVKREEPAAAAVHGGGFVRYLPRSTGKVEVSERKRSASTSPSAWAMSPGRSQPTSSPAWAAPVPKSPANSEKLMKQEGRSGVSGVLKYFRPKKVSPLLEEEYHQYRVGYNTLLQWRFANARAEASMAAVKGAAQGKLMTGWVRISVMRKITMEKRSEIQKVKQRIKLWHVLRSNMGMLTEWWRIEGKNVEAVGRVVRKLSAISLCLPLVHSAEADVMSIYDAVSTATEVMENIKPIIMDMDCQVEKTCFLLTELSVMLKQYKQLFEELEKPVALVASQEAEEKSLRAHHIQLVKEVKGIGTEENYCMAL